MIDALEVEDYMRRKASRKKQAAQPLSASTSTVAEETETRTPVEAPQQGSATADADAADELALWALLEKRSSGLAPGLPSTAGV